VVGVLLVVGGRTLAVAVVLAALALGGPAAAAGPGWVWPLEGPHTVGRPFDPPASRYGPGHRGADLPGRPGQDVRAAGSGRISYAGLLAGRGVLVVVHGDLRTTYEPVTAAVRVGQPVAAGAVIGRLEPGHPGCTGACLHWGLRRGDEYLDPVRLVRSGPSRLLPVPGPALPPAAAAGPPAARTDRAAPATSAVPVDPPPAGAPRPAAEPVFALRGADAAWGSGAVAALVAGLVLLLRPRRPPDGPAAPPLPAEPAEASPPAVLRGAAVGLVDLTSERNRRRPEVA
jgi:murein DD-endopeptidase MepM/ murein hydrolase activator NlpD